MEPKEYEDARTWLRGIAYDGRISLDLVESLVPSLGDVIARAKDQAYEQGYDDGYEEVWRK